MFRQTDPEPPRVSPHHCHFNQTNHPSNPCKNSLEFLITTVKEINYQKYLVITNFFCIFYSIPPCFGGPKTAENYKKKHVVNLFLNCEIKKKNTPYFYLNFLFHVNHRPSCKRKKISQFCACKKIRYLVFRFLITFLTMLIGFSLKSVKLVEITPHLVTTFISSIIKILWNLFKWNYFFSSAAQRQFRF